MSVVSNARQGRWWRIALAFVVSLSFLLLLSARSGWIPWRRSNAPAILALCVNRFDNIAKTEHREILVLARLEAKGLIAVEDPPGPVVTLEGSNRAVLLRANPSFTVFQRGRALDTVKLESIGRSSFDCEELVVGAAPAKALSVQEPAPPSPSQSRSSMGPGKSDVAYTIVHRLALNARSPSATRQAAAVPLAGEPTSEMEGLLRVWVEQILVAQGGETGGAPIVMAPPVVYKAPVDGGKVYAISANKLRANGETDSMAAVAAFVQGAIVPLMKETTTESDSSWGHGYHFLDAIDIEGDGSPELVFQVDGYETTGFQVFTFRQGRCEKVLDLMAWGC